MKKLIYLNDVLDKYARHQDYIKKTIENLFNLFNLDCVLNIKFIDFAKTNEYEETDCMLKSKSIHRHELFITEYVLKTIDYDGGRYFAVAIFHEFEHINDYIKIIKTNHFKFNICLTHQKSFENKYVSIGFLFWTEIDAYYKTIAFAYDNDFVYEKINFGALVRNYKKTIFYNKQFYNKKDLTVEEATKYIKSVDSFIYLCSKFMASVYVGHSKVPYAKIDKDKEYKKVYKILCGLEPKIKRLFNNSYNSKSYINLFRLGMYICKDIRWKIFKVGLTKKDGFIATFY